MCLWSLAGLAKVTQLQTNLKLVMKGSLPFAIDVHMIGLVGCFAIRQYPCEFVDVRKDGSSNNTVVVCMCAHYTFVVGVISPNFGVKFTNYRCR